VRKLWLVVAVLGVMALTYVVVVALDAWLTLAP